MSEDTPLESVLKESPAGVSIISRHRFERLFVNDRMLEMLGIVGREDTPGIDTFVHKSDYDWVMEQLADNAVVDSIEFERRRVDNGHIWWSSMHARPTVFDGKEAAIIWLFDITKLKLLEQNFRELVYTQADWTWEMDAQYNFTSLSEDFFRTTVYTRSEIIGRNVADWVSERGATNFDQFLELLYKRERVRNFEFERKDKSGSQWIRVNATPIWTGGEFTGYRGASTDITELRNAQQQLVAAERLAGLGELVAGVAHEINTPIGVGITASTLLSGVIEKIRKPEARVDEAYLEKQLQIIADSAEILTKNLLRAGDLIRNFKQVAVDQASDARREFNVYAYLADVIHSLSPKLSKSRHKVNLTGDEDIVVNSYPGALAQVLSNLLENSLVHGFPDDRAGEIDIHINRTSKTNIHILYKDNGVGLDEQVKEKIFQPFFTTRRNTGGSGLGMFIVYQLVTEKLGGRIKIDNADPNGFFAEISIPSA